MLRKFFCAFLFSLAFLFFLPGAFASDKNTERLSILNAHQFFDVKPSDKEVHYLFDLGIITGNPDKTLKLNQPINRAEAMTIFSRLFRIYGDETKTPCQFTDVPADAWFSKSVLLMCQKNLIKGYSDGLFHPEKELNRAEAMSILLSGLETIKKKEIVLPTLLSRPEDVPPGIWYEKAALYFLDRNFIDLPSGPFEAEKKMTRKDLFRLIFRLLITEEFGKERYVRSLDPKIVEPFKLAKKLKPFSSNKAFESFSKSVKASKASSRYHPFLTSYYGDDTGGFGLGDFTSSSEIMAAVGEKTGGTGESITNVQEQGVDEGGIVKNFGDYLIMLRRGKLFTVHIKDTLQKIDEINVYPEGLNSDAWYDELLISENSAVVVGYSYTYGATELELFTISDDGKFTRTGTYFLKSNDYYSSRNYASRLIKNELIFYMPHYLFRGDELTLPTLQEWKNDELQEAKEILKKTDIMMPIQGSKSDLPDTLHTIVRCPLNEGTLNCSAKAVLGSYARTFYVSPKAVYLWVSDPVQSSVPRDNFDRAFVFRIDLLDSTIKVVQALGQPIDQFSFKEDGDKLFVLSRDGSYGDAMWNPEWTEGGLRLIRIELKNFSDSSTARLELTNITDLPKIEAYTLQNRFVGDYLLFGESAYYSYYEDEDTPAPEVKLYLKAYKENTDVQTLLMKHSVDRIDVLGTGAAIVIGADKKNLNFTSILLQNLAAPGDTFVLENAAQGELRSHGFFFKVREDGSGTVGLPILREKDGGGDYYEDYLNQSSEIIYLDTSLEKKFKNLGTLKSGDQPNDSCTVSCIDWYGNSRPIFYQGKIYALLGYELVEGKVNEKGEIEEAARLNFGPVKQERKEDNS